MVRETDGVATIEGSQKERQLTQFSRNLGVLVLKNATNSIRITKKKKKYSWAYEYFVPVVMIDYLKKTKKKLLIHMRSH